MIMFPDYQESPPSQFQLSRSTQLFRLSQKLLTLISVVPIVWVVDSSILWGRGYAQAQSTQSPRTQPIIPEANSTGTNITIGGGGDRFDITGGAVSRDGTNLFHSFRQFNLDNGQTANFIATPQIQNILSRMTGNQPSVINGLLQVTGSNANLFLINPAGIVFGNNARLNISGDFTATTATGIGFGNNNWFDSSGNNNYATLNGNPESFLFSLTQPGAVINTGNLSLTPGQDLALVGGAVLNTGNLASSGGNITLMAVPGTSLVRLSQAGYLLSLDIDTRRFFRGGPTPTNLTLEQITPLSLPQLLTGSLEVTGLGISNLPTLGLSLGSELPSFNGSTIVSGNLDVSGALGGNVQILGDRIFMVNGGINASGINGGGNVLIGGNFQGQSGTPTANQTYLDRQSLINADSLLTGNGGVVIVWSNQGTVFAGNISARGASQATTATAAAANGGFVAVSSRESLVYRGRVDVRAAYGDLGTVLLSSQNMRIGAGEPSETLDSLFTGLTLSELFGDKLPERYRNSLTISQANLAPESFLGNILFQATNDITLETLNNDALDFRGGIARTINFLADVDNSGQGSFLMRGNQTIYTGGADLGIQGAGINLYRLDTTYTPANIFGEFTPTILPQSLPQLPNREVNEGDSGTVNLVTIGELNIRDGINTSSVIGAGGRVNSQGNLVNIGGSIDTSSITGNGGAINLNSQLNLNAANLNSSSQSGNAGAIILNSSRGGINSSSVQATSQSGNGGVVDLAALESLTLGGINTSSSGGRGGQVILSSQRSGIITGNINTSSLDRDGGTIDLGAARTVITGNLDTRSRLGNGGNITLSSQQSGLNLGGINTSSSDGNGGIVSLSARGNLLLSGINTRSSEGSGGNILGNSLEGFIGNNNDLDARGQLSGRIVLSGALGIYSVGGSDFQNSAFNLANFDNLSGTNTGIYSGRGGGISLTSSNGSIVAERLSTNHFTSASPSDQNGANIQVNAPGNILLRSIDSQGSPEAVGGGIGGNISLRTNGSIRITDTFRDNLGNEASISSAGGLGGGRITLRYGGDRPTFPFTIGTATINGTAGVITSGTTTLEPTQVITNGLVAGNIRINGSLSIPEPPEPPEPTPPPPPRPPRPPRPTPTPTSVPVPPNVPNPPRRPPRPTPTPEISQAPRPPQASPVGNGDSNSGNGETSGSNPGAIEQINTLAVRQENEVALGALEESFTQEYSRYFNLGSSRKQLSLAETRQILGNIETSTGVRSAIVYVSFIDYQLPAQATNHQNPQQNPQQGRGVGVVSPLENRNVPNLASNAANQANQANHQTKTANSVNSTNSISPRSPVESEGNLEDPEIANNRDSQLEIILVTAQGEMIRQRIPESNRALVLRIAQEFRSQTTNIRNPSAFLNSSQQLYNWFIAPIDGELQRRGVENLVFIMDGGMRSLPLAALHDGEKFIIERYSIGMTPSLSLTSTAYRDIRNSQVLAMGAATFPDQEPLPAVPTELAVIATQLWRGSYFLNGDFTMNNLRNQVKQRDLGIIHLATHASFLSGDASKSFIQLWDSRLGLDQLRGMGWHNPQVDLLVLSACQTAIGDRQAELGFAGVAVQSGVRSAIASLWQVSDEGTLGLMTEFYSTLKQSPIKAEALRQAQLAMQRGEVKIVNGELVTGDRRVPLPPELANFKEQDFTHPYYWSAFTMIGSPW
jgi:filamentous hemagglutinin family protein